MTSRAGGGDRSQRRGEGRERDGREGSPPKETGGEDAERIWKARG